MPCPNQNFRIQLKAVDFPLVRIPSMKVQREHHQLLGRDSIQVFGNRDVLQSEILDTWQIELIAVTSSHTESEITEWASQITLRNSWFFPYGVSTLA